MKKAFPTFRSDEEAERFVETADLSEYDLSEFKPTQVDFGPTDAQLTMRLPLVLLDALKARAKARGIPHTRYLRELIERDVTRD